MSARIERLIGLATLQGPPITGYRRFGVPQGGAFDQESFHIGNAMVGNRDESLAIELSNAGIEIAFSSPAQLAIVGAPVPNGNSSFEIATGGSVAVEAPRVGLRIYVFVSGGWIPDGIDRVLGRAGRLLRAGDVLEHAESLRSAPARKLASPPSSLREGPIRIVMPAGPGALTPNPLSADERPARDCYIVSNQSDRTGIRLDGLEARLIPELTSEPACVGAIQLTPSGQLIIIGPDGPTIGGYPKVGFVCSADLDRLAHLRPGQMVSFAQIDLEEARDLQRARQASLEQMVRQLALALG